MEKLNELPQAFYGVIQGGKVVMLPADDGQWLNKTSVAEAFRALEQRAEAAEAKLAERDKQMNPDYFLNRIESSDKWGPEVELRIYESQLDASKSQDDHGGGIIELFTRPAPAADLAELVPDGWKLVPVEPTEEMIAAGGQFMDGLSRLSDAYDAMLAAAPEVQ